jgi:cell cycle sensor histidine kinase DivJ
MSDVIARHGRNGAVQFVSPAAEVVFGVPAAGLMNNGLFERVHVGDRPAYLTALAHAAAGGESRSVEFRVRRDVVDEHGAPTPQFIWIDMRCRSLDRIADDPAESEDREVVAVMREVTKRKVQEQALEDARVEAERANDAKGRFLATMSHELRTPLNAVIGFSEMLMHDQDMQLDGAQRRDYAHLINDSGHHLLSVVNGILDMSKIETGNFEITPEPFTPAPVIRNCCDLLTLKARDAGVELLPRISADMPEIVADKRALKQIMLNLISNAIKFTDRGGHVVVEAAIENSVVVMRVVDNGVGIAEDDLPRLGDPFFQARGSYARPYDGTGLGLSIVKGLIALHRGRIEIKSRLAEGTCVTVRLPIDCENAADVPGNVTSLPVTQNATPAAHKEEARLRA